MWTDDGEGTRCGQIRLSNQIKSVKSERGYIINYRRLRWWGWGWGPAGHRSLQVLLTHLLK